MIFDFTNYTFSAIVAVFAAIIGMAYPSIQTTIQDLEEKYKSEGIVASFLKERKYILFQASLFIAVVFAILSPFVMMSFNRPSFLTVWMYLHSAITLFLIISTIRLYQLMLKYKVPSELFQYLIDGSYSSEDNKNITKIAVLAKYAADHKHAELYLKCTSYLCQCIYRMLEKDELQFAPNMFYGTRPTESPLTKEMKDALTICSDINNNKDYKALYRYDVGTIVTLLTHEGPIRQGTYDVIWRTVTDAVQSGNKGWFKRYWTHASQHVASFDRRKEVLPFQSDERKSIDAERKRYIEFHTAMGAMLIQYGRCDWIKEILFYSNSLPYKYPLCINTFNHFLNVWDEFQKYGDPMRFIMIQGLYPLADLDEGVNQDNAILYVIEKYLSLMFIRLWQLDENVSHVDPLENITSFNNIDKDTYWQKRLERLRYVVETVYMEGLEKSIDNNAVTKDEVMAYIDDNIKILADDIKKINEHPAIDEAKRELLIMSIKDAWLNNKLPFLSNSAEAKPSQISMVRELPFDIPPTCLLEGYEDTFNASFGDLLLQGFDTVLKQMHRGAFLKIKPVVAYDIDYNNIGEALRRLRLSKDFVILCNDFYAVRYFNIIKCNEYKEVDNCGRYFDDAEFIEYNVPAVAAFLLILRRKNLPYLTLDYKDIEGCNLIDLDIPLYSNIRSLNIDNLDEAVIKVNANLHFSDSLKYIRINMPYRLGKMDLDNIQHIESLI